MEAIMDTAKLTSKGQVTIPKAIRELLGIQAGSRVLFASQPDGSVVMRSASMRAWDELKEAFAGAAEEAGLESDEDVVALIREMRYGKAGA